MHRSDLKGVKIGSSVTDMQTVHHSEPCRALTEAD